MFARYTATLVSSLSPGEVRERLTRMLPRFAVPSGEPIPRFGFSLSRYYLGAFSEDQLLLKGPYGGGRSRQTPTVAVQGTISSCDDEGSLIQLTAQPVNAIMSWVVLGGIGLIGGGLLAAQERIIAFPLVLLVFFNVIGGFSYFIGRSVAAHRFNELLGCLEDALHAQRQSSND